MNIVLGTAQFGMDYGIANRTGRPTDAALAETLTRFASCGGRLLDTAANYGDCEQRLGAFGVSQFDIVTKLPDLSDGAGDPASAAIRFVDASLQSLQVNSLYGVMLHRPENLLLSDGPRLWKALADMKRDGLITKIGYSVYRPDELERLVSDYAPDIVQLPFNVFDQRFAGSGWLQRLHAAGCEIHARSVFLQGVLLQSPQARASYFSPWLPVFDTFEKYAASSGRSRMELCLTCAKSCKEIDGLVVGVDSAAQLQEVMSAASVAAEAVPDFACHDEDLVLPQNWVTA